MQIEKLGSGRFRLDVYVRGCGRHRQVFEGTVFQARDQVARIKQDLKAKVGKKRSLTFGQILNFYWEVSVEPGITPRPRHRSRRAVFPHRALQAYSLP